MAFDPNLPANNSQVSSAELRSQFTGLKALIDAVPAGPQGPPGPAGPAGPAGQPGLGFLLRGDWDHDITYGPGDVVVYNNNMWLCTDLVTGGQPDNSNFWRLLSIVGPAGPEGRGIINVRDNGDGRAVVEMSDGTTYGPFAVANGPAGPAGPTGPQGPAGEVTGMQLTESINSAIGGKKPEPTYWYDRTSETGGYAHLIAACAGYVMLLDGKNDWELAHSTRAPKR
jgi:hypothetical protein